MTKPKINQKQTTSPRPSPRRTSASQAERENGSAAVGFKTRRARLLRLAKQIEPDPEDSLALMEW